jgi:hypothetical protein
MRPVIFAGPTLSGDPVRRDRRFVWRAPASHGDVLRAARRHPAAIGLVDGCFETTPSVWHKEILWALARGVPVFGAASMGALRAAELHDFGMIGVGRVFADFRDGRLRDDDEVAVLHAPAELDWAPMTVAMVDVRATLEAAAAAGVVPTRTRQAIERLAKAMFFKDRTWRRLLSAARRGGVSKTDATALRSWVARHAVPIKRLDARAMVAEMAARLAADADIAPAAPLVAFRPTTLWRRAFGPERAVARDSA